MGLKLNKLKPIAFDDEFTLTPKVTTELKLRLKDIKFDDEDAIANGIDVISRCFAEDDREKVKKFLTENATLMGLYQIQAYLAYGVEDINDQVREETKKLSEAK